MKIGEIKHQKLIRRDKLNDNFLNFKLRKNSFTTFINDKVITLVSTCGLNAYIHGIGHLQKYENFASGFECDIFNFVRDILNCGDHKESNELFYKFIMDKQAYAKFIGSTVDCWTAIGVLADKIFPTNITISCREHHQYSNKRCVKAI
jgi:hypothetical protein